MRLPLFFFGTLRDEAVFRAVVGRPMAAFAVTPANFDGHAVERLERWPYPRLVRRPGAQAVGSLVSGFSAAEIDRMCFFESIEYELTEIEVATAVGPRPARCFLAIERMETSGVLWRIEDWRAIAGESARAEAEICMTEFYGRIAREEMDLHWPEIERRAAALLARRQEEAGTLAS